MCVCKMFIGNGKEVIPHVCGGWLLPKWGWGMGIKKGKGGKEN